MKTLVFVVLFAIVAAMAPAQIVINELVYDDQGTDDKEFIELYNAGSTTINISGYQIFCIDELFGLPGETFQIYTVPPGTQLSAGGFYIVGAATVPNVNLVLGGFSEHFENDGEVILLKNAFGTILDSVCYEANKISTYAQFPTQFVEGQGLWGNFTQQDGTLQSCGRWLDGRDTNNNGADFGVMPRTPGTSNVMPAGIPLAANFDAQVPEAPYLAFSPSFVDPKFINPQAASATNPSAIASSPQGGMALGFWDPTGGGDSANLITTPASDFRLEAWVYFYGAARPAGDSEVWAIGVRGTVDPTSYTVTQSGNTGIAWQYTSDSTGGKLRLVDENDGGNDEVILQTINIVPGVNDGWRRLRLEVTGNQIDAIFGGTYGSVLDGSRFVGTTGTLGIGTVWFGYREMLLFNATARPLTLDDLRIAISPLTSSTNALSVATGGTITFGLHGGAANVNRQYLMVLSVTGGAPGFVFDPSQNNTVIPVVPDWVTDLGLSFANIDPLFGNFSAVLNPPGEGVASSTFPPLPPSLIGLDVWFGYVTFNSLSPVLLSGYSSNSVRLTFTP